MPAPGRGSPWSSGAFAGVAALAYLFLYAPIAVLAVLSFNQGRLSASWEGFTVAWYVKAATNPAIMAALRNSLLVAMVTTVVAAVVATGAALAFHRHRFRRGDVLEGLITIPTVAPEIVLVLVDERNRILDIRRTTLAFVAAQLVHIRPEAKGDMACGADAGSSPSSSA